MLNILVCCANGAGTSVMMKMTCEKAVKYLGIEVGKIQHASVDEGQKLAADYDIIMCPQSFKSIFKDLDTKGAKVIGLDNVMSQAEMEEKLQKYMKKKQNKQ